MTKLVLPVLATSALVLGLVVVPASLAAATPPSTTITVQLTNTKHVDTSAVDATETIAVVDDSTDYYAYAQATGGSPGYVGPIHLGRAVFTVPKDSNYEIEVYGNVDYTNSATSVTIGSGAVTKSLVISRLATISGSLKGPGGLAIHGASVAAIGTHGSYRTAETDSSGKYTIHGLTTGKYRLQFNDHASGTSTAITQTYTWSYWKNTSSWAKTKKVSVKAETSKHSVAGKTGINGTVKLAHHETVNIHAPGPSQIADGYTITFGASHSWNTVYAYGDDPSFTSALNKGKYQLSIAYWDEPDSKYVTLWYTGNGKKPSTSHKKAVTISFAGTANKTINFGASAVD